MPSSPPLWGAPVQPDRPTPSGLRERRKALSLSQSECARRAGVTARSWQRWEKGQQDIPAWMEMFLRGIEATDAR